MKPLKVRLTNPETCRIVSGITKDPTHAGVCPIIITRAQWEKLRPLVRYKKQHRTAADKVGNMFDSMFDGIFK